MKGETEINNEINIHLVNYKIGIKVACYMMIFVLRNARTRF